MATSTSLLREFNRRGVFKAAGAHLATSWFVLKTGEVAFPVLEWPDWVFQALVLFCLLTFPAVLVLSWRYEFSEDGLIRHDLVDEESVQVSHWVGNAVLIVVVLLAAAASVYSYLEQAKPALPGDASIAILPFENLSSSEEQTYFAEGLSEELMNVLAQQRGLLVAGKTSSFAFRNSAEDLQVIGSKLGVATILRGSVRREGQQLRISASLVDVATGYHIWAETYERTMTGVFEIQQDIARAVDAAVRTQLFASQRSEEIVVAAADIDAFDHFLKGRHAMVGRSREGLATAVQEFSTAVAIDPSYARAWAALADVYALQTYYRFVNHRNLLPTAHEAVERALEHAPDLAEAHAALGLLTMVEGAPREVFVTHMRRAVALDPNNVDNVLRLANVIPADELPFIAELLARARESDPLHPVAVAVQVIVLSKLGRKEAALTALENLALDPVSQAAAASGYYYLGDFEQASRASFESFLQQPNTPVTLQSAAIYLEMLGDLSNALAFLEQADQLAPNHVGVAGRIAQVLQAAGETEQALNLIVQTAEKHSANRVAQVNLAYFRAINDQCEMALEATTVSQSGREPDAWTVTNLIGNDWRGAHVLYALRCAGDHVNAQRLGADFISAWTTAAVNAPESWQPHLRLAAGHAALGDHLQATEHLVAALNRELPYHNRLWFEPWFLSLAKYPPAREALSTLELRRDQVADSLDGLMDNMIGRFQAEL